MALSNEPNGESLDLSFGQHQLIGELERRYSINKRAGTVRVTAFDYYARMGCFDDARALAVQNNALPSTALVRRYGHRVGVSVNAEQMLSDTASLFMRAGVADGSHESFDFTDIDQTFAIGFSIKGKGWSRPNDTFGGAFIINDISDARTQYLAAGGLGVLIGDGSLTLKKPETIFENYYSASLTPWAKLTLDSQLVFNPGYNADRGPAIVFGVRLHISNCVFFAA